MSEGARIQDIDALRALKRALWKFSEISAAAIADAEGDVQRTMMWLETEQRSHWQHQLRMRHELVNRAKEALRMKKLYKDPTGARQSCVDEEKALAAAQRKFAEAELKLNNVRKYTTRLEKEAHAYKGAVQRFETTVTIDVPASAEKLEMMVAHLEQYVATRPAVVASVAPSETSSEPTKTMSRGEQAEGEEDIGS